jgi:2-C-methyl-D-erythritol 2,4-cyclodiphosphate synthase
VGNADATIVTEAPRLAPHVAAMRDALATALRVTRDDVSVKATRNEGLGALGRGEGLLALAVVTMAKRENA